MNRLFDKEYYKVCSANSQTRKINFFCNRPLSPVHNIPSKTMEVGEDLINPVSMFHDDQDLNAQAVAQKVDYADSSKAFESINACPIISLTSLQVTSITNDETDKTPQVPCGSEHVNEQRVGWAENSRAIEGEASLTMPLLKVERSYDGTETLQDHYGSEEVEAQSELESVSIVSGTTNDSDKDPDYWLSFDADSSSVSSEDGNLDPNTNELSRENNSSSVKPEVLPNLGTNQRQVEDLLGEIKANGEERKGKKKKDFCLFCECYVLNFARHIIGVHSLEREVKKITTFPPKHKERKKLLDELRRKGNFLNSSVFRKAVRKPTGNTNLLPCTQCKGFFSSKQLWRHRKKCMGESDKRHQAKGLDLLLRNTDVDNQLRERVFQRMRPDDISQVAKSDSLICAFGARYLKSHREQHFVSVTSRKMRELARLLIEIKKLKPQIRNLFDALRPENFELLVSATKIVANYDNEKELYNSASTALNLGTAIKQCAQLAIVFVLKRKEFHSTVTAAESEADLKTLIQLIESEWRFEVSTQASNDLNIKKWNKITMVPLASDLRLMKDYLFSKSKTAMDKLSRDPDKDTYNLLLELVFCSVLLLNRRRPGELQRLPLHIYRSSEEHSQNYEEFKELISASEKVLISKFKRIVIRGKRGRGVPVLFSTEVQEYIKILLTHRDKFYSKNNIYLFGNPGTCLPICGYKVISKHARLSGAKNPKALTATKLRKHLATLTQVLNMTENDIEQLSRFMGHTVNIHRGSYRLPDDIYQTAKLTKLLLLMEKGEAGQFKGKNLDEIDIDLEAELDEEISDNEYAPEISQLEELTESLPGCSQQSLCDESSKRPKKDEAKCKKGKRVLVAWSEEQKNVAKKFFSSHIRKKTTTKKTRM